MIGDLLQSVATNWLSSMFGGFNVRMLLVVAVLGALMLFASAAKKFVSANKGLIFGLLLLGVLVCWIVAPSIGRGSARLRQPLTKSPTPAKKAVARRASVRGNGLAGNVPGDPGIPLMPGYAAPVPMPPVGYPVGGSHPHTGSSHAAGGGGGGSAAPHHAAATVAHTSHSSSAPAIVQHSVSAAPSPAAPGVSKSTGTPSAPGAPPGNASIAANKAQTPPATPTSAANAANKPAPANPATTPPPASSPASASQPSAPRQRYGRSQRQLEKLYALRNGGMPPPKAQSPSNGGNAPAKAGPSGARPGGAGRTGTGTQATRPGATTHPSTETPTTQQYGLSAAQKARIEAQRAQARMADAQFQQQFQQHMQAQGWGGNHIGAMPGHGMHPGAGSHGQVHQGGHPAGHH